MPCFPRQYRLVSLLVGALLVAVLALVFMPMWLKARRSDRLHAAIRTFDVIIRAENDLANHDLDGNGAQDYWCRDIRGLARIRARGSTAGLIDERLASADDSYPDARDVYGHVFKMIELDEDDQPLAGPSGFGPRLAFCMYSAREEEFNDTYMSVYGELWRFWSARRPLKKVLRHPSNEGWSRFGC